MQRKRFYLDYHLQLDLKDLSHIDLIRIKLLKTQGRLIERKTFMKKAIEEYVARHKL